MSAFSENRPDTCAFCHTEDNHPKFHLIAPGAEGLTFQTGHHDCAAMVGHTPASIIVRAVDGIQGQELAARLADPEHQLHEEVRQHTLREAATSYVFNRRITGAPLPTVEELIEQFSAVNPNPSDDFVNHLHNLVGLSMSSIVQSRATNYLNAELGAGSFVARTGAVVLELDTVVGSQASPGTAVSGGSYADQACAFGTATTQTGTFSAQIANSGTPTFTNMPATTVAAIALKDSAGSPVRLMYGNLTSSKTTNSGDTVSVAAGAITVSI